MKLTQFATLLVCSTLLVLTGCNKEEKQFEEDIEEIEQYLSDNNLTAEQTPEGVFYIITKEGTGDKPIITNEVTVDYEGLYLDGVKFDSSYDRGEASTFELSQVIDGWQFGIPKFAEGGGGTLIIPSSLAYGDSPPPGIRNNAILLFNIELISINNKQVSLEDDIEEIQQYLSDNNLTAEQTPEGVFYNITLEGQGQIPEITDDVTVHYEGLYLDGVKFDSSYDQGEPSTFGLSQVIEGWQIGIPLLSEGGAGTLIIPSSLAYGNSPPTGIRNNAIMLFNIELISVN